jgi:acetoacetate decarboxylase
MLNILNKKGPYRIHPNKSIKIIKHHETNDCKCTTWPLSMGQKLYGAWTAGQAFRLSVKHAMNPLGCVA